MFIHDVQNVKRSKVSLTKLTKNVTCKQGLNSVTSCIFSRYVHSEGNVSSQELPPRDTRGSSTHRQQWRHPAGIRRGNLLWHSWRVHIGWNRRKKGLVTDGLYETVWKLSHYTWDRTGTDTYLSHCSGPGPFSCVGPSFAQWLCLLSWNKLGNID